MGLTMLRQMARCGRLEAFLNDDHSQASPFVASLAQILKPEDNSQSITPRKPLDGAEVAKILASSQKLSPEKYGMLLPYLHSIGQAWRNNEEIPHPPGSLILPPLAIQPSDFKFNSHGFSCWQSHKGNSGIQFKNPMDSASLTGFIEEIWQMPLQNLLQTLLLVRIHKALSESDQSKAPFTSLCYFETTVVDASPSQQLCIIEPRHILTHLTVYKRLKGTYGINKEILVMSWALNRGRCS